MRHTFLYVTILVVCITCTSKMKTANSILNFVPKNTTLVVKINDFETLKEELSHNDILKNLSPFAPLSKITDKIQPLAYLTNQNKGLLTFSAIDSTNFDFTYITTDSLSFTKWDTTQKKSIETLSYNSDDIIQYEIDDMLFFSTEIQNHNILSSSQILLKNLIDSIDEKNTNPTLQNFYSVSNSKKVLNLWLDLEHGGLLLPQLFSKEQRISNLSSWISLDLTLNDSELLLNGVTKPNNLEKKNFLNLFNGTDPIPNSTSVMLPSGIPSYTSYGINDFKRFTTNKSQNNYNSAILDSLLNTIEEIGIAEIDGEKILLLRTYGTATLLDYINDEKLSTEEFSGYEISELNATTKIFEPLEPLIGTPTFNYSSVVENTLIFSKTKNTLQILLTNYKAGDTFNSTDLFKNAERKLTSSSSILTVADLKGAVKVLNESVSETLSMAFEKSKLSDYVFGSQIIADDGFYHVNFLIKKILKEAEKSSVVTAFAVQFNTDLSTLPQFVTNHTNRRKEIIVQDQDNILYLISNGGKILWKKQLSGTIQGKVQQVDLFKNNKLQYAFTTNNEFLVLDRNGKEVKPFTKKYAGGNLNPIAVFDYEGKKDYRFVVTQNKKVFMYNNQGKIVKGFKYDTAEADITEAPQHFKVGKKDYLIFKLKNGKLKILNRVGNTRVNLKKTFSFSENEIKLYQNKFTFTSLDGILYQIDTKGKVTSSNLSLAKDHGMDATSRTLAIMDDNILRIRDKKIPLELGVYSKPSIFYFNDKIYISVTDIQNQKIYLFDSQAEPIPNFPILGNSIIDMADMDNTKKASLVLKDQENTIKVFKIQ